jgi:hypothetical protein
VKTEITECPTCKGTVTYKGTWCTMVGYGNYEAPHDHDDNCKNSEWKCENGHQIQERQQNVCPVEGCDWRGKIDCFCSPLGISVLKLDISRK